MSHTPPSSPKSNRNRATYVILTIIAVIVFVVVVALAQVTPGNKTTSAGKEQSGQAETTDAAEGTAPDGTQQGAEEGAEDWGEGQWTLRDPNDPAAIGDIDAPVVITEWTDPRCPFCAHFHNMILPTLEKEYVDTGKVRFEFNTVAFFGDQSQTAGAAIAAAGKQGKYRQYTDALYGAAPKKGHPDLPEDKLIGFAKEAGVPDIEKFKEDMNDQELMDEAAAETATAQAYYGIQAVPFFAASDGESSLSGAQPIENFKEFIDEQLEKADSK